MSKGETLPEKYKNHPLKGKFKSYFDCHVLPDLVLVYKIEKERLVLILLDIETHSNLLKLSNYKFNIIDTSTKEAFTVTNYSINDTINNLLLDISNIDTNILYIKEAYEFIDKIKQKAIIIVGGNNYYGK